MAMLDAKLQPWSMVRDQMNNIVKTTDPQDYSVMVPYGLQLAHSIRHPHVVRCLAFYHTTAGDTYVTHIDKGYTNEVNIWTISSLADTEMKHFRFCIKSSVSKLIFIPQHRVFVGFCTDMTLHVFSDVIHHCTDLTQTSCPATILCMVYIEDTDELVTGGHGCLQAWKMTHAELREPLTPSRPIDCKVTSADWVREMRIDRKYRQLVALCDEGVFIIDYVTNRQINFIRNWHQTALTSCVFYRRLEYFITASMDGAIKVWNAVVFSQVHEFIGHYDVVTGLVMHPSDPLLISSSKDGTVRVWRLDTFELTQRLDVGEKILGMKLANSLQLFTYTLHDIKVWNLNLFHHMFTPIQSRVHKLACVKSPKTPTRILCAAEDGGVRLISAVTGAILTIIYPMATYQVLTDIVYDPNNESIFTVLATGDVLVFNTSSNPCTATQLWEPTLPDDSVMCLALLKLDCALGKKESMNCESLIFAGHNSGQITLLEASQRFMKTPVQAHCGLVTGLECSHGWYQEGGGSIGGADRLLSYGSDKTVRVWNIAVSSSNSVLDLRLICMRTVVCESCPTHVAMLGNVLCMVLPSKTVHMYHLFEDPNMTRRSSVGQGSVLGSSTTGCSKLYTHLKDHDHTQKMTALCTCPSMGLFATTSNDGSVKIWDLTNTLVRELCFDPSLRSVCFANARGDLVVGFQNHVSYVSTTTYLPLGYMEEAVTMEFTDEEKEEPVRFNPHLKLWFDIDSLPTFPAELLQRRQMRQSVHNIRKLSIYPKAPSVAMEDKVSQESGLAESRCSSVSDVEIGSSLGSECDGELALIYTPDIKQCSVARENIQSVAMDEVPEEEEEVDVDSGRGESPLVSEEEISEDFHKADIADEEPVVTNKKKKFPIAPDGYIPNSVIRAVIGYKPPPPPKPPSPWQLKPVPAPGSSTRRSPADSDVSYGNHEPFTWATTSEDDEEEVHVSSYAIGGRLSTIPGSVTPSQGEESEEAHKKGRRFSHLPTPGKVEIPKWEAEETTTKKGKQKRRKSRQINASEVTTFKKLAAKQEEVDEDEQVEEVPVVDTTPELLKRIANNKWFPKGVILNVENVTLALLDLLDGIPDLQYRPICEALVQIYKELGMDSSLTDSVVSKMMSQLKSGRSIARANAVKLLASFGICRKSVIMALLMPMADNDDAVRQEAMEAMQKLAGIKSRTGLLNYLESIGILPAYHSQEKEVIHELQERYTNSPCQRPIIRQSLINLLGRHKRHHEDYEGAVHGVTIERLFPAGEELPVCNSVEMIQTWFSENSMDIGVTPISDEEDYYVAPVKTKKQLRQEKIKERHMKRVPERKERPRRQVARVEEGDREPTQSSEDVEFNNETEEARDEFVEQPAIISDPSLGSTDKSSGSFGSTSTRSSERRRTQHVEMLELRTAMMAKEKELLEANMKERLRKHRERYKQTMSQRKDALKRLLPCNPNFLDYYDKRNQLEKKYTEEELSEESSLSAATSIVIADVQNAQFTDDHDGRRKVLNSEEFPSESGLGSCVFTETTDTKTVEMIGAQSSSGFMTDQESIVVDTGTRPKSSLTVENVQRFEARSAKGLKKKTKLKEIARDDVRPKREIKTPPANWKELYLHPLLKKPPGKDGQLQTVDKKTMFPPIKCIPSKVDLVAGETTEERLLHSITVGSQDDLVDKKLASDRDFGISHYGKLHFTWTTQTPANDNDQVKVQESGDKKVMTSMTTSSKDDINRRNRAWLRQHMLFPSLCKLRVLDERKRQCAIMRRLHQQSLHPVTVKDKMTYQWTTPQPLVRPRPPSNVDLFKEVRKIQQWERYKNSEKRTPMGSKHYHLPYLQLNFPAPEPPIVPRNSTASHSHERTILLPKLIDAANSGEHIAKDNSVEMRNSCEDTTVH